MKLAKRIFSSLLNTDLIRHHPIPHLLNRFEQPNIVFLEFWFTSASDQRNKFVRTFIFVDDVLSYRLSQISASFLLSKPLTAVEIVLINLRHKVILKGAI